ncbi:MAG: M18 family aminopeptidase, partial [Candidatus Delongbacteria bacterium]|nr:M18 family aminopeptidase [Candidatus Delongbacteria bacterium]
LNKGPVIKINANTNYATTAESSGIFEMICADKKIPYQKFVNRSDVRGGGTIGSMIANNIGIRTVDVGNAMLAMHSARETAGVDDHWYMKEAMKGFLEY